MNNTSESKNVNVFGVRRPKYTEEFEKPTVWVINRSAHDYSGAEPFGTIRYMSDGPVNRYATGKIYRELASALMDSSPKDYILLTGLTVMAGIACSIFSLLHRRLNLLIYNPKTNSYVERRMDFSQLTEGAQNANLHIQDDDSDQETGTGRAS